MDFDVSEKPRKDDVEWPQHKQRNAPNDCMRKICSIMVSRHAALNIYSVQRIALCRNTTRACRSSHIHSKMAISNVSSEICGLGVGLKQIRVSECVDHGMCLFLYIQEATGPGSAVAATGLEDEHGVVDCGTGKNVHVDGGCEAGFSVLASNARADGYIYDRSATVKLALSRGNHTVALFIWVYDKHQTVFHLLSKPNANPRVRRRSKVQEDIV